MPTERPTAWKIISKTVRGPAHDRLELPNQDYIEVAQNELVIVAVSDGHGSAKCFRSNTGSQFAAESAIVVFERFFQGHWSESSHADVKNEIEFRLPVAITREWQNRVRDNLQNLPFTVEELGRLASQNGDEAVRRVEEKPFLAYGATIIAVAISSNFLIYLQLGDGDVLSVYETGEVERPLPGDDRLFANETTSLSSYPDLSNSSLPSPLALPANTIARDFRTETRLASRGLPSLILVSTDGYSNSFKDDASFLRAGSDFLELLRPPNGIEDVESNFEEWLSDSAQMSGDDVTVGLLYRRSPEPEQSSEAEVSTLLQLDCSSSTKIQTEEAASSTASCRGDVPPTSEGVLDGTAGPSAAAQEHSIRPDNGIA